MADFKFNCPHCKQSLEAPEELLGQVINCPSCNGSIQLPNPEPQPPATASLPPQDQTRACPFCGETILAVAVKCKHCGEFLHPVLHRPNIPIFRGKVQPLPSSKSRGTYIILGLFLGGLGIHNFYAGRYAPGAIQLIIMLALGWFGIGIVIVGIWVLCELFAITEDGEGRQMQ